MPESSTRSPSLEQAEPHALGDRGGSLGDAELLVEVEEVGVLTVAVPMWRSPATCGAVRPAAINVRICCSAGLSCGRSSRPRRRISLGDARLRGDVETRLAARDGVDRLAERVGIGVLGDVAGDAVLERAVDVDRA